MKKVAYVFIFLIVIVLAYYAYSVGSAYNNITVKNNAKPQDVGDIFESGKIQREIIPYQELEIPAKEADRLDVLILGTRGENDPEHGGLLTDSILLLSLDKKTGKTSMVSIPRDIYVNISGVTGKVNEIYPRGLSKGGAFKFTKETFSRLTGVYIDNLVVFDFDAFGQIVDAVDGITVNLKQPFIESKQWGYEFSLPAGENNLNHEQALYYARSRFSSNDFDRARRQQEIVLAIKEKALSLGFLTNPTKVTALLSALGDNVKIDISLTEIPTFIKLAQTFNSSAPKRTVLSTENVLYQTTENGLYILLPQLNDYKEIQKSIKNSL